MRYATTKDAADVQELARTALEAGIPVSRGGIAQLDQSLDELRQAVAARVGAAAQAGETIPRSALEQAAPRTDEICADVRPAARRGGL
jgi:hypothetical protein